MNYTQLPPTYKDDTIAEAMYAREMEWFHYNFDATNFKYLIEISPDGPHKQNLQERLASTLAQMKNVDDIYAALQAQITDPQAHEAAVLRAIEKRKAEKCATH